MATFPQINGKSISFEDQTAHRLSVEAAAAPIQSRSFDAVTDQPTAAPAESVASELTLHSLSTDSGLHTEKTSEMSSGDFNSKMEDDQPSDNNNETAATSGGEGSKPQTPVRLSRVGSVKSRVNIFQHLDNNNKQTTSTSPGAAESRRPAPKKREFILMVRGTEEQRTLIGGSIFSVRE